MHAIVIGVSTCQILGGGGDSEKYWEENGNNYCKREKAFNCILQNNRSATSCSKFSEFHPKDAIVNYKFTYW